MTTRNGDKIMNYTIELWPEFDCVRVIYWRPYVFMFYGTNDLVWC